MNPCIAAGCRAWFEKPTALHASWACQLPHIVATFCQQHAAYRAVGGEFVRAYIVYAGSIYCRSVSRKIVACAPRYVPFGVYVVPEPCKHIMLRLHSLLSFVDFCSDPCNYSECFCYYRPHVHSQDNMQSLRGVCMPHRLLYVQMATALTVMRARQIDLSSARAGATGVMAWCGVVCCLVTQLSTSDRFSRRQHLQLVLSVRWM